MIAGPGMDWKGAVLALKAFYEIREGALFDSLPIILSIEVLNTS
ncbi:hypothetical protein PABY_15040 [Pyrodictium abyssi]|uniref:Uncharacterized protein n=1 Tax=Pyrodictium abyssi TaxID=54256 RepID=A0ABN6ZUC5_9CREN|nr:hypothetical protein PABY_15040 [Pyrodictium abyssi]